MFINEYRLACLNDLLEAIIEDGITINFPAAVFHHDGVLVMDDFVRLASERSVSIYRDHVRYCEHNILCYNGHMFSVSSSMISLFGSSAIIVWTLSHR